MATKVEVTRFTTRSGWTMIEAETGKVMLHGMQLFNLVDVEETITQLRAAAKAAELK